MVKSDGNAKHQVQAENWQIICPASRHASNVLLLLTFQALTVPPFAWTVPLPMIFVRRCRLFDLPELKVSYHWIAHYATGTKPNPYFQNGRRAYRDSGSNYLGRGESAFRFKQDSVLGNQLPVNGARDKICLSRYQVTETILVHCCYLVIKKN